MGSWNKTCGLTNLHITVGTPVVVFVLTKNLQTDSMCYTTPFFRPLLMPFYSEYNDYGGGENSHGFGFKYVIDTLRKSLVERELGENSYHDLAVTRDDFDEEMFFNVCGKNRLQIKNNRGQVEEVTFVMFHKSAVDDIFENFEQCEFVSEPDGGYHYETYKFSDIAASVPALVDVLMVVPDDESCFDQIMRRYDPLDTAFPKGSNRAKSWLSLNRISEITGNRSQSSQIETYVNAKDAEGLTMFLTETLKAVYINNFMLMTRKMWMPTSGEGSQEGDHEPYHVLINAMNKILANEKASWDREEE
jgi:hypothetical protein